MQAASRKPYESTHFRLQQLADGVYAAIAVSGGAALCNAGIIDLGDCTLVFDSFLTQRAAMDLRTAAEHLTGRHAEYVVNSHYHNDHIRGNQIFPHAKIVATTKTRRLIATRGQEEITWDSENAPKELQTLEAGQDAAMQYDFTTWRGYYRGIIESLPTLELKLPNLTFDTNMVFHGSHRTAEVATYGGGGHTESDAILYLPDERIAFLGDLLFVKTHPWLGRVDPAELIRILDKVETLGLKTVVPGHGPIGTTQDLTPMRQYVMDLEKITAEIVKAGGSEEKATQTAIPSDFETWQFRCFFAPNMRFLYERLSKAGAKP